MAFYWPLEEACDAADAARRICMGGASVVFWSPGSSTERRLRPESVLIRGTRNDPALPVRLISKLLRSSIEAVREIASSLERGGASFGTSPGSMDILPPELLLCTVPMLVAGGCVCGTMRYLETDEVKGGCWLLGRRNVE